MSSAEYQSSDDKAVIGQPHYEDEKPLTPHRNWTDDEERRAKRKLDLIIMPLLTLGFFCLQLDRGNMSNAITDNFFADVGIDQNQFNVGQQMLSLGIVLGEFPSNMILYRLGAKWLTFQIFLFGLVSTFQAFQHGYGAFIATRLLLGLTESGYIPGSLWALSTWYTREETAKRVMFFYFGNQFGQASSKLLAYGLLHMREVGGKPGWFWLLALMGLFTILCAIILGFLLPESFQKPRATFLPQRRIFNEREVYILNTRVSLDDPMKAKKKPTIPYGAFKQAFGNWRLWIHFFITFANNGPQRGFDTYAPSLVNGFGFAPLASNALAAVGLFIQIPVSFGFSWVSDHFNKRGETVVAGMTLHLVSHIFNLSFSSSKNRGLRYFGVVWTQTFQTFSHPLNIAFMSLTCRNSEERALAMAMVITGANLAGVYGAQLYRSDDRPRYKRAFAVSLAVIAAGLTFAIVRLVDEKLVRGRKRREEDSTSDESSAHERKDRHPDDAEDLTQAEAHAEVYNVVRS